VWWRKNRPILEVRSKKGFLEKRAQVNSIVEAKKVTGRTQAQNQPAKTSFVWGADREYRERDRTPVQPSVGTVSPSARGDGERSGKNNQNLQTCYEKGARIHELETGGKENAGGHQMACTRGEHREKGEGKPYNRRYGSSENVEDQDKIRDASVQKQGDDSRGKVLASQDFGK